MVGEDSRSTDLSVSGKEGHSTNYWLITSFFFIFIFIFIYFCLTDIY